jgi:hypothetical protein
MIPRWTSPSGPKTLRPAFAPCVQKPAATRARQLLKLLQSIERDLRRGGAILGVVDDGATVTLRTHNPSLRLTRTLQIPAEDFGLLAEVSPVLRSVEKNG